MSLAGLARRLGGVLGAVIVFLPGPGGPSGASPVRLVTGTGGTGCGLDS
ncbi:MAG: hypothetical protein J2P19_13040 [Pseudonocardia sp.]|nr:hypothetical protein [Pseudonocardia sp.]